MATKELTAKDLNVTDLDSPLAQDIILHRRQYFINKVKQPLMKSLVWAFDKRKKANWLVDRIKLFIAVWSVMQTVFKYPEPTRENCYKPLTHALMDFWDDFMKWEDNPEHPDPDNHPFFGREQLWRAARRVELSTVEHDAYYEQRDHRRIEWMVRAYLGGKILPQFPAFPDRRGAWREPLPSDRVLTWLEWLDYKEDKENESNSSRQTQQRQ